jgi:hypothetical protein
MRQAVGLQLENGHVPGALPRAGMKQAIGLKANESMSTSFRTCILTLITKRHSRSQAPKNSVLRPPEPSIQTACNPLAKAYHFPVYTFAVSRAKQSHERSQSAGDASLCRRTPKRVATLPAGRGKRQCGV